MGVLEKMLIQGDPDRKAFAPFWPDEKRPDMLKPVKRVVSNLTSASWDLSLMPLSAYEALAGEISALASSSVERNIFLEPEFAMATLQRVEYSGVLLLCLWETLADKRMLRFFMPIVRQKAGLPRHRIARSFTHHFAPLGTPLLHRDNADEAVETLLRLLSDPELDLPAFIAFDLQRLDGEVVQRLKQAAVALGLPHKIALGHKRALLKANSGAKADALPYLRNAMGAKRHREARRLLRRLGESGVVSFNIAQKPDAILDALEGFLTLEARGWKGRGGTALYSLKQIAAFSRQAVASLAAIGQCEIHTMHFEGRIIAALICFKQKGEYFAWKVAFDENFKTSSPGVQVIMQATEHWQKLKSFKNADSLAAANHTMMDRVWQERLNIGTLLIGTGKTSASQVLVVCNSLERIERFKNVAKSLLKRKHVGP